MTRDEFLSLPASVALGILYEGNAKIREIVTASEKPKLPRSPKYDMRVYRKGGWNYASEMELESLQFWHGKAVESAASGGQYADKDTKKAAGLAYWVEWRRIEPAAAWSGEREHKPCTASPPSRNPALHSELPADDEGDASFDYGARADL